MSAEFDALRQRLDNSVIRLGGGDGPATAALLTALAVPSLTIQRSGTAMSSATSLSFGGTADVVNLQRVGLTVTMTAVADGVDQLTVGVDLPANWAFPASFPDLPPSFHQRSATTDVLVAGPSLLSELAFDDARIVLSAGGSASADTATLAFTGTSDPQHLLEPLRGLASVSGPTDTSGTIQLGHGGAVVGLDLRLGGSTHPLPSTHLSLGALTAGLHVAPDIATGVPELSLYLEGVFELEDGKVMVPVRVGVRPGDELWAFRADVDPPVTLESGLGAILSRLDSPKGEFRLPHGLADLGTIGVSAVTATVDMGPIASRS